MASTPNRIHFVSRYSDRSQRGWTDLGGGLFSTESWAVSAEAAQSVNEVWLHDRKTDTAWDGGHVVGAVPVQVPNRRTPKWRFTVRRNPLSGVSWPGAQGGGPEKAYV
jgi:hypothetical protein